jgi:hypothetical protein
LAPSTGYIKSFEVLPYHRGFYISMPSRTAPEMIAPAPNLKKMFTIFDTHSK